MKKNIYSITDDQELWLLLLAGETIVLEILYKKHYSSLLDWGLKYTTDQNLVEDCIHDLFVKLYTSNNLKPIQNIHAYLLRSLRNALFDKLSQTKKSQTIDQYFNLSIEDSDLQKIFYGSDEELTLSKRIRSIYKSLSKQQQQIIYMRYVKGLSHKEISSILGINLQSSMNLASRTLQALRRGLGKISSIFF